MSIFKDDIGLNDSLPKLQPAFRQEKVSKEISLEQVSNEKENIEEAQISENAKKRQDFDDSVLESLQEDKNVLEVEQQGLSAINNELKDLKGQVEKKLEKKLEEEDLDEINLAVEEKKDNIKNIVENTSFNGKKVLEETSSNNTKTNMENGSIIKDMSFNLDGVPIKTREELNSFLEKIDETTKEIEKEQEEAKKKEEKIVQEVNSIIEIEFKENPQNQEEVDVNDEDFGNKLKETAINGIVQHPDTGKKIQISSLDENMILALLSVCQVRS